MKKNYYVNKNAQPKGEHEVHTSDCSYLPKVKNGIKLGKHPSCASAIRKAKKKYPTADGCYWCCPKHNKR